MAKTKVVFVSQDGKQFEDEAACDAHDTYINQQKQIEAYITGAKLAKAQAGLMRKHIAGWLVFQATGRVPALAGDESAEAGEGESAEAGEGETTA